jgi:hypothetical protein
MVTDPVGVGLPDPPLKVIVTVKDSATVIEAAEGETVTLGAFLATVTVME